MMDTIIFLYEKDGQPLGVYKKWLMYKLSGVPPMCRPIKVKMAINSISDMDKAYQLLIANPLNYGLGNIKSPTAISVNRDIETMITISPVCIKTYLSFRRNHVFNFEDFTFHSKVPTAGNDIRWALQLLESSVLGDEAGEMRSNDWGAWADHTGDERARLIGIPMRNFMPWFESMWLKYQDMTIKRINLRMAVNDILHDMQKSIQYLREAISFSYPGVRFYPAMTTLYESLSIIYDELSSATPERVAEGILDRVSTDRLQVPQVQCQTATTTR